MITTINEWKNENTGINEADRLNAIPVTVYKSDSDSTNGGLTANNNRLLLAFDDNNLPFQTKDNEDYLVLIKRQIGNAEILSAKPASLIDTNIHSMFGGNFIYSSDSRFPSTYPIPVHDRVE